MCKPSIADSKLEVDSQRGERERESESAGRIVGGCSQRWEKPV